MIHYIPRLESTERYDDGVAVDYAAMIRMWSAFDRSIARFNRECGLPAMRQSRRGDVHSANREKRGR